MRNESVSVDCGPGGCGRALERYAGRAAAQRRRLARAVQDRARLDALEAGARGCRCGAGCTCDARRLSALAVEVEMDRRRTDRRRLDALRAGL